MNFISGYIKKDENVISFFPDNEKQKSINLNSIKTKVDNSDEILLGIRPEHIFLKKEHAVRVTKDHNFAEIEVNPNNKSHFIVPEKKKLKSDKGNNPF